MRTTVDTVLIALKDLADGNEHVQCLVARPGEMTYECDAAAPCVACQARQRIERLTRVLGLLATGTIFYDMEADRWCWRTPDDDTVGGDCLSQVLRDGGDKGAADVTKHIEETATEARAEVEALRKQIRIFEAREEDRRWQDEEARAQAKEVDRGK